MTSFNLAGMLSNNFFTSFIVIPFHSSWVISHNCSAVCGSLLLTLFFNTDHRFSIMFRSGDRAGQSLRRHTCRLSKNSKVDCDLWHGAPSCMNIEFSFSNPMRELSKTSWFLRIQCWRALAQNLCSVALYSSPDQYGWTSKFHCLQGVPWTKTLSNWSSDI